MPHVENYTIAKCLLRPFGFPVWLLVIVFVVSGFWVWAQRKEQKFRPDLVIELNTPSQERPFAEINDGYEELTGISVGISVGGSEVKKRRDFLASQSGNREADVVIFMEWDLSYHLKGPASRTGFLDLRPRLEAEGLIDSILPNRLGLYSFRNRIYALPADAHPVFLCYRRDLVESLGIDVAEIKTWDDFVAMGRRVTQDFDRDGIVDHYALSLPTRHSYYLLILLLQQGVSLFDREGNILWDSDVVVETIQWYCEQLAGERPIAYQAGFGQPLYEAIAGGSLLFFFASDWRLNEFRKNLPELEGKLALMPLPSWKLGVLQPSTWGGSGYAISSSCEDPDKAWDYLKYLLFDRDLRRERFVSHVVATAVTDHWDLVDIEAKDPFYSDQLIGKMILEHAASVPANPMHPYKEVARRKLWDVLTRSLEFYRKHGGQGIEAFIATELRAAKGSVNGYVESNRYLMSDE